MAVSLRQEGDGGGLIGRRGEWWAALTDIAKRGFLPSLQPFRDNHFGLVLRAQLDLDGTKLLSSLHIDDVRVFLVEDAFQGEAYRV